MKNILATAAAAIALISLAHNAFAQEDGRDPGAMPARAPQVAAATPLTAEQCHGADPYKHHECLDTYLGTGFVERLFNYYKLEWGQSGPPSDPNAPASRREGWPATPQMTPPMPFTEWPFGAATAIGVNRPSSVDSPLMAALGNSDVGDWMNRNHLQFYGWVDGGGNISPNTQKPGGNAPAAYDYTPNTVQLDQAVVYLERTPDTVQTDHIDWGFRLSAIYGENYRYTTAYGVASYQLLKKNDVNGYDFPMMYGEVYIPQVAQGLLIRFGRYIAIPDIEAQLAPNNYMYSHSMSYSFDNYTNTGLLASLEVTPQLLVQAGVNMGTESALWHWNKTIANPFPNPLYPGTTMPKDPGAQPSFTACVRYTWNDGKDDIYPCANGINNGKWGYNNLQWYGVTYYHKFNDHWHISSEFYDSHQNNVPNLNNPTAVNAIANGGTPFSPQYMPFNAPDGALCNNPSVLSCKSEAIGIVSYINYSPDALNNFSFRPEYFNDKEGQRTGVKTRYVTMGIGWQHWFSPQIEIRPEVTRYIALDAPAFNGNAILGIAPDRKSAIIASGDIIVHF